MKMHDVITIPMILTVGEMLTVMRKRAGLSIEEMAEESGVFMDRICALEGDLYDKALVAEYMSIADVLGITLHMGISDEPFEIIEPAGDEEEDNG